MADTYLSVFDESGQVIGRELRSVVHRDGLLHREVHIWFLLASGEVVLQRRSATKDTFPFHLDVTAGGHVEEHQDFLAAAIAEIYEETGLRIDAATLVHLAHVRSIVRDEASGTINNASREVYAYRFDGHVSDLRIEPLDGAGFETIALSIIMAGSSASLPELVPAMFSIEYRPVWEALLALTTAEETR